MGLHITDFPRVHVRIGEGISDHTLLGPSMRRPKTRPGPIIVESGTTDEGEDFVPFSLCICVSLQDYDPTSFRTDETISRFMKFFFLILQLFTKVWKRCTKKFHE